MHVYMLKNKPLSFEYEKTSDPPSNSQYLSQIIWSITVALKNVEVPKNMSTYYVYNEKMHILLL